MGRSTQLTSVEWRSEVSMRGTLQNHFADVCSSQGIGAVVANQIQHAAILSTMRIDTSLHLAEIERPGGAATALLKDCTVQCISDFGDAFPADAKVSNRAIALYSKCSEPCPDFGTSEPRIVGASRETIANRCPGCQTGGKILADRSLSRLLKDVFPRTMEELDR